MKYAEVSFGGKSEKAYTYEVPSWVGELAEGDAVVVPCGSRYAEGDRLMVGTVAALAPTPRTAEVSEFKPLVCRVDVARYERELAARDERRRIEEAMERRLEAASKMSLYRQLAEEDPEMKRLLAQYEGVGREQ